MSAGMAELRMMSADELCDAELKAPRQKMHTLKITAAQMHAVARRQSNGSYACCWCYCLHAVHGCIMPNNFPKQFSNNISSKNGFQKNGFPKTIFHKRFPPKQFSKKQFSKTVCGEPKRIGLFVKMFRQAEAA